MKSRAGRVLVCLAGAAILACGSPFEGLLLPVPLVPTEATLTDFRTGPLHEPSAYDLIREVTSRVDQGPNWDFLFELDEAGEPLLSPFGAVTGEPSDAGLQRTPLSFEEIVEAPREGYATHASIAVTEGDVLFAVSRRDPALGGIRCRRFAKLRILAIDAEAGTLTFEQLTNPNCEVTGLVPGETGEPVR